MNDRPEQPTGQPPLPAQPSSIDWLKVIGLIVTAVATVASVFWIGYRVGRESGTPPRPQMLLQWGLEGRCGFGFTPVPMSNWPGPGDEPVVCRLIPDSQQ